VADPFQSRAQQKKWDDLRTSGKISESTYTARAKATGDANLPERVGRAASSKRPSSTQYDRALKRQVY
jgi:hypothetical protein